MNNTIGLITSLMGHWELLGQLGHAAEALIDHKVKTVEQRWEIIRPVGDALAPVIDEIMAKLSKGSTNVTVMSTQAEMEESLLSGMRTAYIGQCVSRATSRLVVAAGASEEDKKKIEQEKSQIAESVRAEATQRASRFDGKWLKGALEVFKTLAPVLLPLLLKAA